ncbi:MAG: antibiotic biosynthesis monooxygenase [Anaerolineales bacterium]|nr:antibiotic biosynthesis monooxygenase [Anaerolineales bacterium]
MYARVVTAHTIKPEAIQEGIRLYEESIMPAMKAQPGFVGTLFLVNEAENKVISISLWETEAAMQASEASGYLQAQMAKVAPLVTAPPTNEHFETAVQA